MLSHLIAQLFMLLTTLGLVLFLSSQNTMISLVALAFCFFCSSVILTFMGSEFIALMLTILYMGAIIVFFLFSVMFLDHKLLDIHKNNFGYVLPFYFSFGTILFYAFIAPNFLFSPEFFSGLFYANSLGQQTVCCEPPVVLPECAALKSAILEAASALHSNKSCESLCHQRDWAFNQMILSPVGKRYIYLVLEMQSSLRVDPQWAGEFCSLEQLEVKLQSKSGPKDSSDYFDIRVLELALNCQSDSALFKKVLSQERHHILYVPANIARWLACYRYMLEPETTAGSLEFLREFSSFFKAHKEFVESSDPETLKVYKRVLRAKVSLLSSPEAPLFLECLHSKASLMEGSADYLKLVQAEEKLVQPKTQLKGLYFKLLKAESGLLRVEPCLDAIQGLNRSKTMYYTLKCPRLD